MNNPKAAKTAAQYDQIVARARDIFRRKSADYGPTWRILRPSALTDQMYIKAKRLRQIQQTGRMLVNEDPRDAFYALVNYAAMALVQLDLGPADEPDMTAAEAEKHYLEQIHRSKELMLRKTTDYDEAWREMRISSMTDLILQKLLRIKQMEQNRGQARYSEGPEGNYRDILNYAVFSLIRLDLEGEEMD